MNRADLQILSEMRLQEARALLASGNPCGAYYLAGYAVECALKACIAKQTRQYDFPDKKRALDAWEHVLEKLVVTAELKDELAEKLRTDRAFGDNWNIVKRWVVESRYNTSIPLYEARSLIDAVQNEQNGVLIWLQQYW